MRLLLGIASAAAYFVEWLLAGIPAGLAAAAVLTWRTRRQHPRTDFLSSRVTQPTR